MARSLLVRGMLVGLLAGLLAFVFARLVGEPEVERAIAFETRMDQAKGEAPEPEMVSRGVQRSAGLLTGVAVYGTAIGGLFGLEGDDGIGERLVVQRYRARDGHQIAAAAAKNEQKQTRYEESRPHERIP